MKSGSVCPKEANIRKQISSIYHPLREEEEEEKEEAARYAGTHGADTSLGRRLRESGEARVLRRLRHRASLAEKQW